MPDPNAPKASARERTQLRRIYQRLLQHFGPQHWWPSKTPFETMIGALLTQNTTWRNAAAAVSALDARGLLDPERLLKVPPDELAPLIRTSGYFRQKSARVHGFLKWFQEHYGLSIERMRSEPLLELRRQLLTVNGIGPETADSILLYALEKPVFVVDAYTRRVFSRHGIISGTEGYEWIRGFFESALPSNVDLYNEYHALIVRVAVAHCRKRADCEQCPLRRFRHRI
jgi:endonuclease-3 related protein